MRKTRVLTAFTIVLLGFGVSSSKGAEDNEKNDRKPPPPSFTSPPLKPDLKYPTLEAYEAARKGPGVMLDSPGVRLFVPKQKAAEAKIIFGYLVRAYDELYRIVGQPTEYKIVVYHFPKNHLDGWGGTSLCTLWYGDENLNLSDSEEWKRYHVPHVSGYIEEMAHNFVSATYAQFGWEMVGWSLGMKASAKVADNPVERRRLHDTREEQARTFRRYVQGGYVFPKDLKPNLCDRIHAHLLYLCEKRYGPKFWPDFFNEIRKERDRLIKAVELSDGDKIRNERYRITVECFNCLPGLNFKDMLTRYRISDTVDIKSLHPTQSGWNRKFVH